MLVIVSVIVLIAPHATLRLFNELINDLQEDGLGWKTIAFADSDGSKFIYDFQELLWYVSCHWEEFSERGRLFFARCFQKI